MDERGGNHPVILPISGKKLRSITAGTRSMGRRVRWHYSEQRLAGRVIHVLANSLTTLIAVPLVFLLPRLLVLRKDAEIHEETPGLETALE
jgi:hypothetical protein